MAIGIITCTYNLFQRQFSCDKLNFRSVKWEETCLKKSSVCTMSQYHRVQASYLLPKLSGRKEISYTKGRIVCFRK